VVAVIKIGTEFLSAIRDKAHCICTLKMFRRKLDQWLNSTSEHHTGLNLGNQPVRNQQWWRCRLQTSTPHAWVTCYSRHLQEPEIMKFQSKPATAFNFTVKIQDVRAYFLRMTGWYQ
jgi:hypothetical protein